MIPFAMVGAAGRMGRTIISLSGGEGFRLSGALEHTASVHIGLDAGTVAQSDSLGVAITDRPEIALSGAGVAIDFSSPDTTMQIVRRCRAAGIPLLIGTTGLSGEQKSEVAAASVDIPVMISPNMSVGVNLLFRLAAEVARILGDGYDIEIVEAHHRHKKDAPSGTALRIKDGILETLNRSEGEVVYGRSGVTGERRSREIGIHAVRGGDTVGDHTVLFMAEGERIELTHRASSRNTFARGALRAAAFLYKSKPGLYSMDHVLGS
jgi:4-hydroxy-tetrahydrodipicolinate reductase